MVHNDDNAEVKHNRQEAQAALANLSEEDRIRVARMAVCMMLRFQTSLEVVNRGFRVEFKFPDMYDVSFSSVFDAHHFGPLDFAQFDDSALQEIHRHVRRELQRRIYAAKPGSLNDATGIVPEESKK